MHRLSSHGDGRDPADRGEQLPARFALRSKGHGDGRDEGRCDAECRARMERGDSVDQEQDLRCRQPEDRLTEHRHGVGRLVWDQQFGCTPDHHARDPNARSHAHRLPHPARHPVRPRGCSEH
eukprot:3626898-Rhodomonas_salina.2